LSIAFRKRLKSARIRPELGGGSIERLCCGGLSVNRGRAPESDLVPVRSCVHTRLCCPCARRLTARQLARSSGARFEERLKPMECFGRADVEKRLPAPVGGDLHAVGNRGREDVPLE